MLMIWCVCVVWCGMMWCGVEWSGYGFLDNFMIYWNTNWWKVDVVFIQCSGFVIWIKWLACCRTALAKAIYVQSLCTRIQRYHMLQSISCFRSFKEEIRFWKFVLFLLDSETRPNSFWIRCEWSGKLFYDLPLQIKYVAKNLWQNDYRRLRYNDPLQSKTKAMQWNATRKSRSISDTEYATMCLSHWLFSGWFRCWRLV